LSLSFGVFARGNLGHPWGNALVDDALLPRDLPEWLQALAQLLTCIIIKILCNFHSTLVPSVSLVFPTSSVDTSIYNLKAQGNPASLLNACDWLHPFLSLSWVFGAVLILEAPTSQWITGCDP
jgi:hypothetical protein